MRSTSPLRRWLPSAAAVLLACAGGERRPATPAAAPIAGPAPAEAATFSPPAGFYGEEPAVHAVPIEEEVAGAVRARLARAGTPPALSRALVRAARTLALGAAEGRSSALEPATVRAALSHGLAHDPAPAAFLVRGPPAPLPAVAGEAVRGIAATHFGVGAAERDGTVFVVVLASERKASLARFPAAVAPGASAVLSGELVDGLHHPRVFVTLPSGAVQEEEVSGGGRRFSARVHFATDGRHAVQLVAEGSSGPEVCAQLAVWAGKASPGTPATERPAPPRRGAPPDDPAADEAEVVRALNALRAARGLAPVRSSPPLAAVARSHSAAMLAQGRVAHVLPGSGELGDRLRRAGVPYRRAYENVARASTALEAHDAAVASPAHLANLLQPAVTQVGVGVVRGTLPSGAPTVYLTEILLEAPDGGEHGMLRPEGRVREAVWAERFRLGGPPLTSDPALDAIARDAAQSMRERDAPDAAGVEARALGLRRGLAAVDVFVASAASDATRSANLGDRRFRRVGVGVAEGDSRRFGAARLFIVVVYTD